MRVSSFVVSFVALATGSGVASFAQPTTAPGPPIPIDVTARILAEAHLAAEEDGGRLWGRSLDGPLLLVDPQTRFAVGNRADDGGVLAPQAGVFAGTLPATVVIANTATDWGGVRWTMVMWGSLGDALVQRRRLLLHECWHRIQPELGFPAANGSNEHLDTLEGRYLFLLELRALATALRSEADTRTKAIRDALIFRAARRAAFPAAAANERALENNEGLAEYTGFALRGTGAEEARLAVARRIDGVEADPSFVRSFAYQTGPAYGLLLDAIEAPATPASSWRASYRADGDLDTALRSAAKVVLPADVRAAAGERAAAYRGQELRASEEGRDRARRERLARLHAALVDGPTLTLPMEGAQYGFDPNGVVPMPGVGTVYEPLDVSAPWGRLQSTSGVLVSADWKSLVVSAPAPGAGSVLHGKDWTLTLAPGWKAMAGARAGDLLVVRGEEGPRAATGGPGRSRSDLR